MRIITIFLGVFLYLGMSTSAGQRVSREIQPNFPPISGESQTLRAFPCSGTTIYEEGFDGLTQGQLPLDWSILDLDTLSPHLDISYMNKGWQAILDFKDSSNIAMATPSWYVSPDSSDDWLITQKVELGSNPCVSWYAYSQDIYYPEKYQVLVSTTTPDTAGFLANKPLRVVNSEFYSENYRSAILTDYKNKEVYLAFRQKSYDKFILVLDNVRFAEVLKKDPAMFSIRTTAYADTSKIVAIRGAIINRGSDTLAIDSAQLFIHYQVNNGMIESAAIKKKLSIAPNDTLNWLHDSTWKTPNTHGTAQIKCWFTGISGQPVTNDTLSITFGIYPTSISPMLPFEAVSLYPNPCENLLNVRFSESILPLDKQITVMDIMGKMIAETREEEGNPIKVIDMNNLPSGMYFVRIETEKGQVWNGKFLKL